METKTFFFVWEEINNFLFNKVETKILLFTRPKYSSIYDLLIN